MHDWALQGYAEETVDREIGMVPASDACVRFQDLSFKRHIEERGVHVTMSLVVWSRPRSYPKCEWAVG